MTILDQAYKAAKEVRKEHKKLALLKKKRKFCLFHGICPDCAQKTITYRSGDCWDRYYCYSAVCSKTGCFGRIKPGYKGTI